MRQNPKNVSPMSNEGRNAYVITHMTEALLSLMQNRNLDDISISAICDAAGVGRASFYRNFECKEDILRLYISQLFHSCIDSFAQEGTHQVNQQVGIIFAHFIQYRDFYRLLNERGLIYLIKDVIMDICGPKPGYSKLEAYATAFVAYSLYGWIEVWFQRGMQESAEEMEALFNEKTL